MNRRPSLAALALVVLATPATAGPENAAPKGDIFKFSFDRSKVFPGTVRDCWVYVPKQYDPSKPACVHVNQDGIQYNAPAVFDELIHRKEIPVVIGVFVMHGRVKSGSDRALDRFNRSYEYDGLGDNYARFLLEELLPEVETRSTPDGRPVRLSHDGNDRCIAGSSSGAICAFTAAWERPDAFRRVFSAIGTFVGLRGGNDYLTLVRKFEPKPIRVFLQDGRNDLNNFAGDWWMANQEMERALTFAGYEVAHAWGEGGHDAKQATAVFPEAVRWLWKDWPAPVKAGRGSRQLQDVLMPGEGWVLVGDGYKAAGGPASNAEGEVVYNDLTNDRSYKVGPGGSVSPFPDGPREADGQAFGPDGRLYSTFARASRVMACDPGGTASLVADGVSGNHLTIRHDGGLYLTGPGAVWFVNPAGEKRVADGALESPSGVALSPDQSLLYVADGRSHWVYSYVVRPDGSLVHKQKYYHLHVPDSADDAGAGGMRTDRDGRLYVATRMGVQVCDQAGRVNAIIPTPNGKVSDLTFGGPGSGTLFVTCGDRVYRRKLRVKGAKAFEPPVRPTPPRL